MEVRNCLVCGVVFPVTRKDKKCCSQICSASLSSRKSYAKKKEEKKKLVQPRMDGEPESKECNVCNELKDITDFYFYRGTRYNQCRLCVYNKSRSRYVRKTRELNGIDSNLYSDLEEFLMSMKRKRFMANEIDIFKLIDMYDRVFPTGLIPIADNQEDIFNMMFFKLASHYRVEKYNPNI